MRATTAAWINHTLAAAYALAGRREDAGMVGQAGADLGDREFGKDPGEIAQARSRPPSHGLESLGMRAG